MCSEILIIPQGFLNILLIKNKQKLKKSLYGTK